MQDYPNNQKYKIIEILGQGGFGSAYKVLNKGKELSKKINSDEGVDEGATIQAKLIKDGKINDTIKFIDITT